MSKLDELIEWHEKHATYYTDSAVLQQAHRDTAEALRLCRDVVVAVEENNKVMTSGTGADQERHYRRTEAAVYTAIAALRDAGLIERGG